MWRIGPLGTSGFLKYQEDRRMDLRRRHPLRAIRSAAELVHERKPIFVRSVTRTTFLVFRNVSAT